MLNRRQLRVRVLQNLYALHQSQNPDDTKFWDSEMEKSTLQIKHFYAVALKLFIDVLNFEEIDVIQRKQKHIPSEEDKIATEKVANSQFVKTLTSNISLEKYLRKYKLDDFNDAALTSKLFKKFRASEQYSTFIAEPDNFAAEKLLIIKYFNEQFITSDDLDSHFDEIYLNWESDKKVILGLINNTLNKIGKKTTEDMSLEEISPNWPEDHDFMIQLFQETRAMDEKYSKIIADYSKNWDAERVAIVDGLLIKMSICEFFNFPSIPVKVTINEYVEIAKAYSTPKSKVFVNGIIDKLLKDFTASGEIKKSGRGLVG
ncbi:MAG: N utilization substance protein B [Sphingobacteriales bacterium]|jgi:N utilization substance protein B